LAIPVAAPRDAVTIAAFATASAVSVTAVVKLPNVKLL
jgi:hypothetical protein